jgi:hypothetical protein
VARESEGGADVGTAMRAGKTKGGLGSGGEVSFGASSYCSGSPNWSTGLPSMLIVEASAGLSGAHAVAIISTDRAAATELMCN